MRFFENDSKTTVQMDNNTLLDMLVERVRFWTDDNDTIELYEEYYYNLIESGCLEGAEIDVSQIVDNDYINWFTVMDREELNNNFDGEDDDIKEGRIMAQCENNLLVYCC